MKRIVCCLLMNLGLYVSAQQSCPVIPLPASFHKTEGNFSLTDQTLILVNQQVLEPLANYLQKELLKHKSLTLSIGKAPSSSSISLNLNPIKKADTEKYQLEVNTGNISISAPTANGIFNGISTLLQLIRQSAGLDIECWKIADAPKYDWRGLMLDESRYFFGKEKVKQLLDWMAFYKLNRFHWHLTDQPGWRLDIKKYPKLALIGGIGNYFNPFAPAKYYSQEDINDLVLYAAERHIQIIPEIDMPGHATAANMAYPAYSGGGTDKYPEFTFNPGKEATYQYLTNILKETDVLFPSQMIHIGGDEVAFGNKKWNTDPEIQKLMKAKGLNDLKAVEHYFIKRMADSVIKMNNKVLAWDEVADAGLPAKNTVVFWWRHDKPNVLKTAFDKGISVVLTPRIPLYFDFVQDSTDISGRRWKVGEYSPIEKVYNFSHQQIPEALHHEKNIMGIQASLWTETVNSNQRLDYLLFPRISALAEAAWTRDDKKNFEDFQQRLKAHLEYFKTAGIYYYNNKKSNPEPLPKKISVSYID
ncbi:beta-N-acetylhexosaminidase [Pedobacter heparinus]|uniref:beta-N-acetylhexosaminidase n=1 Tax=Pedobacter heparinus TaxID=984 RepID=UPI00292FEBDC|nr:beta-N-acetylhexosaminidase [Pedobacter heparinus]